MRRLRYGAVKYIDCHYTIEPEFKARLSDAKVSAPNVMLPLEMLGQTGKCPIKGTCTNQDRLVEYGLPWILRNKWMRAGHGEEDLEHSMFKQDGNSDQSWDH